MNTTRYGAAAAPLPDGEVLIAGGLNSSGTLSSAELFNPTTSTFSTVGVGAMTVPRAFATATPLPNGEVLIAGGFDGANVLSSAELLIP